MLKLIKPNQQETELQLKQILYNHQDTIELLTNIQEQITQLIKSLEFLLQNLDF